MIYAYVALKITDPTQLAAYRDVAADALAKHGGEVLTAAREFTTLDGAPETPDMVALLIFPDKDSAIAWSNDPELAEVHALRRGAGASDIFLLG